MDFNTRKILLRHNSIGILPGISYRKLKRTSRAFHFIVHAIIDNTLEGNTFRENVAQYIDNHARDTRKYTRLE